MKIRARILRVIIVCSLLKVPFVYGGRGNVEKDPNFIGRAGHPSYLSGSGGIKGFANIDSIRGLSTPNGHMSIHLRGAGSPVGNDLDGDRQLQADNVSSTSFECDAFCNKPRNNCGNKCNAQIASCEARGIKCHPWLCKAFCKDERSSTYCQNRRISTSDCNRHRQKCGCREYRTIGRHNAVTGLAAVYDSSADEIIVTWDKVKGPKHYNIFVSQDGKKLEKVSARGRKKGLTASPTFEPGRSYEIAVRRKRTKTMEASPYTMIQYKHIVAVDAVHQHRAYNDVASTTEDYTGDVTGDVLLNDSDPDFGHTLTVDLRRVSGPPGSRVIYSGDDLSMIITLANGSTLSLSTNGNYIFRRASGSYQDLSGTQEDYEEFKYVVGDNHGNTAEATLYVRIQGANDAPIALNDLFIHSSSDPTTIEDVADGCVLENDKDIDIEDTANLAVCVVNGVEIQNDVHQHVDLGQHTKLSIGADGCFTMPGLSTEYQYLPKGETADMCFFYQACDGFGYKSNVAEACVRVEGVEGVISSPKFYTSIYDDRQFSFHYEDKTATFRGPAGTLLNVSTSLEIAEDNGNRTLLFLDDTDESIRIESYTPDGVYSSFEFREEIFWDLVNIAFPSLKYSASLAFDAVDAPSRNRRTQEQQRKLAHSFQNPSNLPNIPHAFADFFVERCDGERFDPGKIEVTAFYLDRLDVDDDIEDRLNDLEDEIQKSKTPLHVEKKGIGHYRSFLALEKTNREFIESKEAIAEACDDVGRALSVICEVNKYLGGLRAAKNCATISAGLASTVALIKVAAVFFTVCMTTLLAVDSVCAVYTAFDTAGDVASATNGLVELCKKSPEIIDSVIDAYAPDRVVFSANVVYNGGLLDASEIVVWDPRPEKDGYRGPNTTFTAQYLPQLAYFRFNPPDFDLSRPTYEAWAKVVCMRDSQVYKTAVSIVIEGSDGYYDKTECLNDFLVENDGRCLAVRFIPPGKNVIDTITLLVTERYRTNDPKIIARNMVERGADPETCGRRLTTYYTDDDLDGFGDPAISFEACGSVPPGYVENNLDCDDKNADVGICNGIDGCELDGDCPSHSACIDGTCVQKGNPRFTLSWTGDDDLDLHAIPPGGEEIYFDRKIDSVTRGNLDTDIIPESQGTWAENINVPKGPDGTYTVWVHQYDQVGTSDPFKLKFVEDAEGGDPGVVIYTHDGSAGLVHNESTPFFLYLKPDGVVEMLQPE